MSKKWLNEVPSGPGLAVEQPLRLDPDGQHVNFNQRYTLNFGRRGLSTPTRCDAWPRPGRPKPRSSWSWCRMSTIGTRPTLACYLTGHRDNHTSPLAVEVRAQVDPTAGTERRRGHGVADSIHTDAATETHQNWDSREDPVRRGTTAGRATDRREWSLSENALARQIVAAYRWLRSGDEQLEVGHDHRLLRRGSPGRRPSRSDLAPRTVALVEP